MQIAQFLLYNSCNQCLFLSENEVDGSVLMDENLDESIIQELIPTIKQRLLFKKEREKLRFVKRQPF
jgi:hypothetical protein